MSDHKQAIEAPHYTVQDVDVSAIRQIVLNLAGEMRCRVYYLGCDILKGMGKEKK